MVAVRIEGPDSTKQWRVVRCSDAVVLMDGFSHAATARHWCKRAGFSCRVTKRVAATIEQEAKKSQRMPRSRNPQLLTIGNPSKSAQLNEAISAYRKFHGCDPRPQDVVHGDGQGVLIALGELRRVDYKPRRGERRAPTWFHHFKPGCVLCATPDGRRLVILDREAKRLVDFARGIIR